MLKIKNENPRRNILIINELDDSIYEFRGERYDMVFIHKDNKNIEQLKELLEPNISIMGKHIGNIFIYGEEL